MRSRSEARSLKKSEPMALEIHIPTMVKVADLNPSAYNPRKISPEKYEALKESIRIDGFVEPIVVQKKGLRIIGGHQRRKAVMELSVEACMAPPDLPCIVLDIEDVRAKKLNIKLNNVRGDFEARMLGELLIDIYDEPLKLPADDVLLLGFEAEEALKFMHLVEPPLPTGDEKPPESFAKSVTISIEFDSVKMRDRVKEILMERSKVEKKKAGDIVAALLFPPKKKIRR